MKILPYLWICLLLASFNAQAAVKLSVEPARGWGSGNLPKVFRELAGAGRARLSRVPESAHVAPLPKDLLIWKRWPSEFHWGLQS